MNTRRFVPGQTCRKIFGFTKEDPPIKNAGMVEKRGDFLKKYQQTCADEK
jgi:hypothetical protein